MGLTVLARNLLVGLVLCVAVVFIPFPENIPWLPTILALDLCIMVTFVFLVPKPKDPSVTVLDRCLISTDELMKGLMPPSGTCCCVGYFKEGNLPTHEETKQAFIKMATIYPRFRSVPVVGANFMESAWPLNVPEVNKLEMEHHVIEHEEVADERESEVKLAELINLPVDKSRPWWRVDILPQKSEGGIVMIRMHHAIADGLRSIGAFGNIMSFKDGSPAELELLKKISANKKSARPSALSMMMRLVPDFIGAVVGPSAEKCSPLHDHDALFPAHTPRTPTTRWVPFSFVKEIRNKTEGGTINDILMTAMCGALRKYGVERGKPAEGTVRALCAFSMPDSSSSSSSGPSPLYNDFLMPSIVLPIEHEDRGDRLKAMQGIMGSLKRSLVAPIQFKLMSLLGKLGLDFIISDIQIDMFRKHSMVYSNVPGFEQTVELFAKNRDMDRIACFYPNVLPQAIFMTYRDQLSFSLIADEGQMPNSHRFVELFIEEIVSWHNSVKD